ncbi:MAG TPA: ABC transporter permease [Actinocrinis sp.]|nr:ABC transporter permease [Actinocrinis sp.]
MTGYLIRRFGTAIVIVLGVTLLTFAMLHIVAPANAAALATLGPKATPAAIKAYDHANGFDRPLIEQYLTYLNRLLHGNLGWSYHFNQSVTALLGEKAPLSAFLSGSSLVLAVVIAIPLGIYQAIRRNTFGDITATSVTFVLYSMPVFFFAIILIQLFALTFNWVDPGVGQDQSLTAALGNIKDLILPIVALSSTAVAGYSRYQRSSSLDVLAQDYIKVVRAKGLSERLVLGRHLVRNACLPMITLVGISLPALIGGNLLIEFAFNINGLGLLFINGLQVDDYNIVLAYTLLGAVFTVVGNLIADIALSVADPRIRLV